MKESKTYFQPISYFDDGTNIEYGEVPEELNSFDAFETREDCEEWLDMHDYDASSFAIIEYHDNDIENVRILDKYGIDVEDN